MNLDALWEELSYNFHRCSQQFDDRDAIRAIQDLRSITYKLEEAIRNESETL